MTLRDRFYSAETSPLTFIGRTVFLIILVILFFLPKIIFPGLFTATPFDIEILNHILGSLAFYVLFGVAAFGSFYLIMGIAGLLSWLIFGNFHGWSENIKMFIEMFFFFIFTIFRIFFGEYDKKWHFLKEWFQKDKIAKELLESDDE